MRDRKYKTEVALIKGSHANDCKHPSVIHFSFSKAASQYIKSILANCAIKNDLVPVGIHDYAFHSNVPFLDSLSADEMEQYKHIFKSKGYMYSSFGGMIERIDDLESYKVVLVARDPRDMLVSLYYSMTQSHEVPTKKGNKRDFFVTHRNKAQKMTIDDYVVSESNRMFDRFSRYQTLLLDKYNHVYVTKYEEMITDFKVWLSDLINYCELDVSEESIQCLIEKNEEMKPKKEDVSKQMRKGIAGDYKEKLKPETIQILNKKFEPILKRYQYE